MEIKRDRMVHLGYGKYWRSDDIMGLLPIENGRGPGRRTEVYVSGLAEPVVASKSEESILAEMAAAGGEVDAARAGTVAAELREALQSLSPVLRRMLRSEARFDVEYWVRRLRQLSGSDDEGEDQEDLFGG